MNIVRFTQLSGYSWIKLHAIPITMYRVDQWLWFDLGYGINDSLDGLHFPVRHPRMPESDSVIRLLLDPFGVTEDIIANANSVLLVILLVIVYLPETSPWVMHCHGLWHAMVFENFLEYGKYPKPRDRNKMRPSKCKHLKKQMKWRDCFKGGEE